MSLLKEAGSNLRQFVPISLWPGKFASAASANPEAEVVANIDRPRCLPSSSIAQQLAAVLDKSGSLSLESLVKTVADDLYRKELRKGGAVLDLGLFGSYLFSGEVIAELRAGDGIFWRIKKKRGGI